MPTENVPEWKESIGCGVLILCVAGAIALLNWSCYTFNGGIPPKPPVEAKQ